MGFITGFLPFSESLLAPWCLGTCVQPNRQQRKVNIVWFLTTEYNEFVCEPKTFFINMIHISLVSDFQKRREELLSRS